MKDRVLEVYQDKTEAEIVKALLESSGIKVILAADDAGGFYPSMDALRGVKLIVDETDYEEALSILNSREFENSES